MSEQTPEYQIAASQEMTLEQLLARLKEDNHPWLSAIGIFEDDAFFEGWQQAIQDYRRSVDENPQAL